MHEILPVGLVYCKKQFDPKCLICDVIVMSRRHYDVILPTNSVIPQKCPTSATFVESVFIFM